MTISECLESVHNEDFLENQIINHTGSEGKLDYLQANTSDELNFISANAWKNGPKDDSTKIIAKAPDLKESEIFQKENIGENGIFSILSNISGSPTTSASNKETTGFSEPCTNNIETIISAADDRSLKPIKKKRSKKSSVQMKEQEENSSHISDGASVLNSTNDSVKTNTINSPNIQTSMLNWLKY